MTTLAKAALSIPKLWESFKKSLTQEEEAEMKVYTHTDQMPDWAQDTFYRLIDAGIVKVDSKGEIAVQECSVQPMVYLDRQDRAAARGDQGAVSREIRIRKGRP